MFRLLSVAVSLIVTTAYAQDASIRVGGSTTALPIISSCAAHFMEKYSSWDKADAALGKEQTVVYVTGGGSGFGVKGLMNGTIDLGMVSRDLQGHGGEGARPAGHARLRARRGRDRDQHGEPARQDQAAASRPPSSPAIFSGQLGAVLAGRQEPAGEADGAARARRERRRDRDLPGTRDEAAAPSPRALQFPSTAALIKKLETNDAAIAFVSAGAVSQDGVVRTYAVDGVMPTQDNIVNGKYALNRPMLIVAKPNPPRKVQLFMDYVLGDCQATVKEHGLRSGARGR